MSGDLKGMVDIECASFTLYGVSAEFAWLLPAGPDAQKVNLVLGEWSSVVPNPAGRGFIVTMPEAVARAKGLLR